MGPSLGDLDAALAEWFAAFNIWVVPTVVAAVVAYVVLRTRRAAVRDPLRDRERAVRWIGLLNFGLALRAALRLVPEIDAFVRYGGFSSFPISNVFWPVLAIPFHTAVGFGLRRLRTSARWGEVALNLFVIAFILLAAWFWSFGATFDGADWPETAVAYVLPFFLVFVMLLPGTGRVFSRAHRAAVAERAEGENVGARMGRVSIITLAFLVVLSAVLFVSAADLLIRYGCELFGARIAGAG
jgi:hypothetical protein